MFELQFNNFGEFLDMGGYAFNVWTVYALFAVFILANLLIPLRRRKQIIRELKRRRIVNEGVTRTGGNPNQNQERNGLNTYPANGIDTVGENQ
ncbi:MAG: heme exporter protein CcmD [Pseudohongiellaceae bacterium]